MVLSSVLNLFFIPVLYVVLKTLLSKFSRKAKAPGGRTELSPPRPSH
jgi:HAE1 family hydrophobic/amphiphilic exporter-1